MALQSPSCPQVIWDPMLSCVGKKWAFLSFAIRGTLGNHFKTWPVSLPMFMQQTKCYQELDNQLFQLHDIPYKK